MAKTSAANKVKAAQGKVTKNAPTKAVKEPKKLTPEQVAANEAKKVKAEEVAAKKEVERVALLSLDSVVTPSDIKKAKAAFIALNGGTGAKKRVNWLIIGKLYASLQTACENNSQLLKTWSKNNGLGDIDNSSRSAASWFYDNEETIMQIEQKVAAEIKAATTHNKTCDTKDKIDVKAIVDPSTQNSPKHLRGKVGECLAQMSSDDVTDLGAEDMLEAYTSAKAKSDKVKADKVADKEAKAKEEATKPFDAIAAAGFAIDVAEQVKRFTSKEQLDNFSKEMKAAITARLAELS